MAEVRNLRRFYLLKRCAADERDEEDAGEIWRGKQEEQPATPLPADFYLLSALQARGYTAREDLDGADETELTNAGLSPRDAKAVLKAWAELP